MILFPMAKLCKFQVGERVSLFSWNRGVKRSEQFSNCRVIGIRKEINSQSGYMIAVKDGPTGRVKEFDQGWLRPHDPQKSETF